jgi:hypothetical protein
MMRRVAAAVALMLAITSMAASAESATRQGRLGLALTVTGASGPPGRHHHGVYGKIRLRLQVTISKRNGQVVLRRKQYARGEQILYYRLQPGVYRIAVMLIPPVITPSRPCAMDGETVKVQAGRLSDDGVRCEVR